jgi:hypothetical protein
LPKAELAGAWGRRAVLLSPQARVVRQALSGAYEVRTAST